ncbi:MAG: SDR family NAD(P)-dependent oxidoreductase [Rickettsiales bacterium]
MSHAFILGATSTLARSVCQQLGPTTAHFTLVGRDEEKLERLQRDLSARTNAKVSIEVIDLLAPFDAPALIARAEEAHGPITHGFSFPGALGNGRVDDAANIAALALVNYVAPAQFLTAIAARMQKRRAGQLVVISSVAGDRGRASNYAYGAAKAALSTFTGGLRQLLHESGVQVLLVKPGFIDTPMAAGVKSKLMASPDAVAAIILKAMEKGSGSIYAPWFWRIIMGIIIHLPAPIFNRLKL